MKIAWNEEGLPTAEWTAERGTKREKPKFATYLEGLPIAAGEDRCDWSPPRVSTSSPLESLEVGFRFGFIFSRE